MRAALHVYGVYRAQEKYWGDKNQGEKRNENKNSLSEHNMYTYTWLQSMQFFHWKINSLEINVYTNK